jgi:hypothetical protein
VFIATGVYLALALTDDDNDLPGLDIVFAALMVTFGIVEHLAYRKRQRQLAETTADPLPQASSPGPADRHDGGAKPS